MAGAVQLAIVAESQADAHVVAEQAGSAIGEPAVVMLGIQREPLGTA